MLSLLAAGVFVLGYILITLEHKFHTNKSAIALALAAILWIITSFALHDVDHLRHAVAEAGTEVFNIVVFLLAAMTLVEILIHYRFFDVIRVRLLKLKLDDKRQFLIIGALTFFLSAILDNLTITIVMIQIARRFFKGQNLLIVAAGIVILANAGGAWSPLGDVTTIMIWLAGKFSALEIIMRTFFPSLVLGIVAAAMLVRQMTRSNEDLKEESLAPFSRGEKLVIGTALGSFTLPLVMSQLGLQPYFGLLLGLGIVWLVIDFVKARTKTETHLTANIESMLQKTDIASIKFFIGILLAVSALHTIGVLEIFSHLLFGETQEYTRVIVGNVVIGLLSAIVDNVPLTALALDIITLEQTSVWTFLAYCVGTGGSALLIGSVAGVIAGGMVKELTFGKYLKIATIPAVVGYFAGIGVWILQRMFIFSA